jgi:hypothetical protein
MAIKLKRIRCNVPSNDSGDKIKLELVDENGSLLYNPPKLFKSNETKQIDAAFPPFGQVVTLKLYVLPNNFIEQKEIHVSSSSGIEENVKFQKERTDYDVAYEIS